MYKTTQNLIKMKKINKNASLLKERDELKEKLVALIEFINTDECFKLSANHRALLANQKGSMEMYLDILNKRLYEDVDSIPSGNISLMSLMLPMLLNPPFGSPSAVGLPAENKESA